MRIALICTLALTMLSVGGIAVAQQPNAAAAPAVSLPAIDTASLAGLTPVVAHIIDLNQQARDAQSQFRVASQTALNAAKLDPAYYGVRFSADGKTIQFAQIRQFPTAVKH